MILNLAPIDPDTIVDLGFFPDDICWYTWPNGDYCGLEAGHKAYIGTVDWPDVRWAGNHHRPPHPSERV